MTPQSRGMVCLYIHRVVRSTISNRGRLGRLQAYLHNSILPLKPNDIRRKGASLKPEGVINFPNPQLHSLNSKSCSMSNPTLRSNDVTGDKQTQNNAIQIFIWRGGSRSSKFFGEISLSRFNDGAVDRGRKLSYAKRKKSSYQRGSVKTLDMSKLNH